MDSRELVCIDNVSKSFGGVLALQGVSLTVNRGEVHALVGENGSGKSTLIKVVAGVLAPDSGTVRVQGVEFHRLEPITAIRQGIQIIYQDFALFPNLTVAENIALNTELAGGQVLVRRKRILQLASQALQELGIHMDLDERVENIPVSRRQLVAIARALLQDARLIIMDEPTTTLSRREVEALYRVISRLKASGVGVLFVSHKLNEVCEMADCITVLRNGLVSAEFREGPFSQLAVAEQMTGRQLRPRTVQDRSEVSDQPLLKVINLTRSGCYSNISFQLHRKEILGITGLLGSGQTELALGLFGLLPADSGQIHVDGARAVLNSAASALQSGIAHVPEDRLTEGLFLQHSIAKNLAVSRLDALSGPLGILRFAELHEEVRSWMQALSIVTPSAQLPVEVLSGGNQQRVVIGRWLSTRPRILLLNHPTAGVDVGSKYEIHRLIRRLVGQGMGVILISDDLPELLENCDRLLLMRDGKLTAECRAAEIDEDELSRRILGGTE